MHESTQLDIAHAEWLEDVRKIPVEVASEAGVISKRGAIGFVYRKNGQPQFAKFRTLDKTKFWIEPAGIALCLWNLDSLAEASGQNETLIITEGEFDALSWMVAGAPYVVSVPNGAPSKPGEGDITPSSDGQFAYLWHANKIHPDIAKFDRIVLATDGDTPGKVLRDELAIRLGRPKCWFVNYPAGCKDANDVLKSFGTSELRKILDRAQPLVPNKLVPFSSIPERAARERFSSGWSGLDKHLLISPPELMVVTGVPGSGKSQWTLCLCANLARVHGLKGAILQFEDNPDRNRRDLLAYARAWTQRADNAEDPAAWVDRMFLTISPSEDIDDEVDFNIEWLHGAIHEAACRHGARWVLIDPWNEIEHAWKVNENETTYTNKALRDLKRIARRYQIALIVVTHPTKGVNGKPVNEISLYDISGSSAWKNKADHGIVVYRETPTSAQTVIKVDKSKDWVTMGVPGAAVMNYDPATRIFSYVSSA